MEIPQTLIDLYEFNISNVDDDIAEVYRNFGHGKYESNRPLLIQLCRNTRALISILKRMEIKPKVKPAYDGSDNRNTDNDAVQPNDCPG